jgi:FkbM family methyltransferase
MSINIDETPGYSELRSSRPDYGSQFEILVSYIYHHIVRDGAWVVDGGANAGLHSVPLANLVGSSGRLVSFEPNPETAAGLRRNLARFLDAGTAEVRQEALGNSAGELRFTVNRKRSALSRITTDADKAGGNEEVIVVPVVKMDDVIRAERLDFIKLDLEGFDFNGMRGGELLISKFRPPIVFENGRDAAAQRYGYTKEEFFYWFDQMNYVLTDLHNRPLNPNTWSSDDIAFECIALHRDDARRDLLQRVVKRFWATLSDREVLVEWRNCVQMCRRPIEYVGSGIVL